MSDGAASASAVRSLAARARLAAADDTQLIAVAIYVIFIGLTPPLFLESPIVELAETTVSRTLGRIVPIFPLLLFAAAAASQRSAAVAEMIGSGGLLAEVFPFRLSERVA
jgi:hypothetical protein